MAFVYDDGSTTPGYNGSITVGGIRLNSASPTGTSPAGGTFKLDGANPFFSTPPTRVAPIPLGADSGGIPSPIWYDSWQFPLTGWLWVPSGPDDVPAAQDQLRSIFSARNGMLTLVGNARGWANKRQLLAQTVGQITFEPRDGTLRIPTRNFTIPMLASDPLAYDADNLKTATLPMDNSANTLTSSGVADAPFTARFTGPFNTAASLIRNSDGAAITLSLSLTAGQYVDVTTNAAGNAVISATKSDDTNVWNKVTAYSLLRVAAGANVWRAAGSSGTTGASQVTVTWRDVWA